MTLDSSSQASKIPRAWARAGLGSAGCPAWARLPSGWAPTGSWGSMAASTLLRRLLNSLVCQSPDGHLAIPAEVFGVAMHATKHVLNHPGRHHQASCCPKTAVLGMQKQAHLLTSYRCASCIMALTVCFAA